MLRFFFIIIEDSEVILKRDLLEQLNAPTLFAKIVL